MALSVTTSTTLGKPLDSMEIYRVMEACDTALEFAKCKCRIYSHVESHMTFITPNLFVLVGALISAKLMGVSINGATLSPFFRFNPLLGKGFGKTAIVAPETNTREADPVPELASAPDDSLSI
ncbi:hypothetical protein DAPPUDRAFT_331052 [Daphnia pulex]|uniref:Nop domain-containing protein n=1 Tax=Daphnia pulex TaxID=6669 RepID=E9HLC7_DAPPU|nr:hypothetical protein DAPPUDRAFT_331052 [Daphnia pulex]|eukprot:EFX67453.1 hypothetical protein DAPPUDRAFT_331052 [Daphnia pulex]